jgi:hypothetical protein
MSPEVAEQAASPWATRLTAVAIAAGISAGLGACTTPEHPQATPSSDSSSVEASRADLNVAPGAVCQEPEAGSTPEPDEARRCADALKAGTLAVVNYGVPSDVVKIVDGQLGGLLNTATNGKANLRVVGVNASSTAKAQLSEAVGIKGCIDNRKRAQYGSQIADITMPELHQYNFILALSNERACVAGVGGSTMGGRHADMFLGNLQNYKQHGQLPRGVLDLSVHEVGHELGLGHAGVVSTRQEGNSLTDIAGLGNEMGKPLDLLAYLKGDIVYEEYGDIENIMGIIPSPDYVQPNIIQEAQLSWPEVVLEGEQANPAKQLGEEAVIFDEQACSRGEFATVELRGRITLNDSNTKKNTEGEGGTQKFTSLVVAPHIAGGKNYGIELYLVTESGAYARLGGLGNTPGEDNSTVISYGNQKISVAVNGAQTTVRSL